METEQDKINQWQIEGRKLAIEAMCSGVDLEELRSKLDVQYSELRKKSHEYNKELTDYYELLKSQGKTEVPKDSAEYKKFHFLVDRATEAFKSLTIISEELIVLLKKKVADTDAETTKKNQEIQELKNKAQILHALNIFWRS